MQVSIQELCDFINYLPDCYYFEDISEDLWDKLLVSGNDDVWRPSGAKTMIDDCDFFCSGYIALNINDDPLKIEGRDALLFFREWQANQKSRVISIRVPNDKMEDVLKYLSMLNIKPL